MFDPATIDDLCIGVNVARSHSLRAVGGDVHWMALHRQRVNYVFDHGSEAASPLASASAGTPKRTNWAPARDDRGLSLASRTGHGQYVARHLRVDQCRASEMRGDVPR